MVLTRSETSQGGFVRTLLRPAVSTRCPNACFPQACVVVVVVLIACTIMQKLLQKRPRQSERCGGCGHKLSQQRLLPSLGRKGKPLLYLTGRPMDLLQRLLGTVQRAVDFISTFTTYLLGDEAHPGAEESGSSRETVPRGSRNDCSAETAQDRDIFPEDDLKAFEGPPIAETIPPNQEIQGVPGKDFGSAQATEAVLGASERTYQEEGQEDVGQKLSESPQFLADALRARPRPAMTGSVQPRGLEGPLWTGGLHPWEPKGSTRTGALQQELLEGTADLKAWKPKKMPAEEPGRAREAEGTWQKEQKPTVGDGQEAAGGGESSREEQRGLGGGAAQRGGFQQQGAKTVEDLQLGSGEELLGRANTDNKQQQEKPDVEVRSEGVQPAVPESAGAGGDQEGEAEARSRPQWEPEERLILEGQEEDAKEGVTEEEGGQQRGPEGSEMEGPQLGRLEGFVRNEEREQEENEGDEQEATGGEEQRGDGTAWTERFEQEVAKTVGDMRPELDGQLLGGTDMEDRHPEESDIETGGEGVQAAVPESGKARADQEGGPGGEAEAGSRLQWEPEERVVLGAQEENPVGTTETGDGLQRWLEEAEQRELEGFVRVEGTPQRVQEDNEGQEQEATGRGESVMEEQRREGTVWTGRSQWEVDKMVEGQWLEAEGQLSGGAEAENYQQGEPDVESGDERSQQTILDGAGTGGDEPGGREGEAEAGRNLQQIPEKTTVTLEERPEEGLKGAEEGEEHQFGKLEGLVGSEVENEEEEEEEERQEEPMGEPGLGRDQQDDPEALAGITVLEEVVGAALMEKPEVQGQESRETEERTERTLPHEPLGDQAPVDPCCPAGARAFPEEGPSLDTSAQKERVLLRRKSSIRRAPSLKRPRPATETPPLQETGVEENSPSQPPSQPPTTRPNLRHAGFGPMHPNMMAELQTRLRRPQ